MRGVFHLNLFLSTLIGEGRTDNTTGEDDDNVVMAIMAMMAMMAMQ